MKMHLKRIFLQYFIGCLFIASVSSDLSNSPYKYKEFFNLEKSIVKNLDTYIKYEIGRLEILNKSTGYEDEIPFVEKRIELLTEFQKEAERNASAVTDVMIRDRAEHPTSALAAINNFIHHWDPLFQNETLYGFRLLEFLNVTKEDLPGDFDLLSIKASLVYMHVFYNLSAADIYNGVVLGVKGEPLNVRDALDLAEFARTTFKLGAAKQWFEVLLDQGSAAENRSDINVPLAMTDLAFLYYQFGEHEKAKKLAEEAHIKNETDENVYRSHMLIQAENVPPIDDFEDNPGTTWRNFTSLCRANTTFTPPLKWYHRCRYKCSQNPLRRYKEEILSMAPYVSVIHDLLDEQLIDEIKSKSLSTKKANVYPAPHTGYAYHSKCDITEISSDDALSRVLDHLSAEITSLNASYLKNDVSSGSPNRVVKFGLGGKGSVHDYHTVFDLRMFSSAGKIAFVNFYLTDVEKGGATVFLDIGVRFQPKKGSALIWYVAKPNGEYDTRLSVAECPLVLGEKWVVEKEIHRHNNDLATPCALKYRGNRIGMDRALHPFRHCRL